MFMPRPSPMFMTLRVGVVDSVGRDLLSIWTRPFGHFSHLTNRGILAAARDPEFSRLFRSQLKSLTRTNSAATYVAQTGPAVGLFFVPRKRAMSSVAACEMRPHRL